MWQGIVGHDDVVEQFRRTLASKRLASTYLFVGPPGVGKRRFAIELARSLLCLRAEEAALAACGGCDSCRSFAAGSHPDLDIVGLPKDKVFLPISLFVGDDAHRNQEGLCPRLALKPFFGRRKIAIVDDADHFNISSANCLLKTLEEPPANALLILIGTSPARQLPTIRSRSQIVRFRPLDRELVRQILIDSGLVADAGLAESAAELSEGSVERAVQMADPALRQFREQLQSALRAKSIDPVRLGRAVQAFVDEAGKEAVLRRIRLRTVIGFAIELYRDALRHPSADPCANERVDGAEPIVQALDGCVSAIEYVERNANQGLLIQAWCEGLVPLSTPHGTARVPTAAY